MSGTLDRELGALLERSAELGVIRAGVAAAAGGEGRAVVVEGPAGIGKSALVEATRMHASEVGMRPLTARGTELERAFGFGVVRQLLEPAVQDRDAGAAFGGSARYAAALLDVPLVDPAPLPFGPEGAFLALQGLYRLTANLARERPLALLVDDAHWADGASLRFLAYLHNRLDQLPVLLVVAARPLGEPGGAGVAEMLRRGQRYRPAAAASAQRRRIGAARARRFPGRADAALPLVPCADGREPVLPARACGRAARRRSRSCRRGAGGGARRRRRVGPGAARPFPAIRATARRRGGDRRRRRADPARGHARRPRRPAGRRGRRRAARRSDPGRHARAAVRAPDHPQRRPRAAVSCRPLRRPRARGAHAGRRGRRSRASGRAPARDRAARLRLGLRQAPRRRARGGATRRAGRLGDLPATRAGRAALARQPPRRAAGARARGVAHARP